MELIVSELALRIQMQVIRFVSFHLRSVDSLGAALAELAHLRAYFYTNPGGTLFMQKYPTLACKKTTVRNRV